MEFFVSLIEYAQRHYSFLLLLVFLLTFSKSCALISLLVPGTSGLLLLGPLASGSLNHFLFMWLSASLGAIGGFWISWWLGRYYQHRLLRLRWLRGDRLARSLTFLHRHGEWAVFFGRFLRLLTWRKRRFFNGKRSGDTFLVRSVPSIKYAFFPALNRQS